MCHDFGLFFLEDDDDFLDAIDEEGLYEDISKLKIRHIHYLRGTSSHGK